MVQSSVVGVVLCNTVRSYPAVSVELVSTVVVELCGPVYSVVGVVLCIQFLLTHGLLWNFPLTVVLWKVQSVVAGVMSTGFYRTGTDGGTVSNLVCCR